MDLEGVKKQLERGGNENENSSAIDSLPSKFFDHFIMAGIKVHSIQPGRILCSFKVPPRLLNSGGFMHGGATASLVDLLSAAVIYSCGATTTGVSVEINVSYLDAAFPNEEVEIEAKALRVGKTIAVVSVELKKKETGKIIAQGRHTKYIASTSKL